VRISPFECWEAIAAIEEELDPRFAAIPVFTAGTGGATTGRRR
jgi:hypothetical protein